MSRTQTGNSKPSTRTNSRQSSMNNLNLKIDADQIFMQHSTTITTNSFNTRRNTPTVTPKNRKKELNKNVASPKRRSSISSFASAIKSSIQYRYSTTKKGDNNGGDQYDEYELIEQ
eukprot:374822_1